jgi:hypothetical protein
MAGQKVGKLLGLAVVNMLAAFLQSDLGETARQEALKVLGLIGDTSEDETVQAVVAVVQGTDRQDCS